MKRYALTGFVIAVAAIAIVCQPSAVAQQKVESMVGVVEQIDRNAKTATLKTDSGEIVKVTTVDSAVCLRIPAGEKTLSKAAPIKLEDISTGDRVLVHGMKTDQTFIGQRLVVMPMAEVAKKREHDLDEWKRRGIGGIVREVNSQTGEITLELRGQGAGTRVEVGTTKANFRRYVAGSLRFEEARTSTLTELRVGDQLRALGDKSADGRSFVAEQIVSGAFKTIGVTVLEIDQQKHEIHATTLDQKKPITIAINQDSVLHRISPPVAAAIAQKVKSDASKPSSPQAGQKPGQPVIDVQQMIDTLPAVSLAEIKAGDVLAVTGAVERDESRVVAIKVSAGVDLVLKALAPPPGKPQVVRLSAGLPSVFDFSVIPVN